VGLIEALGNVETLVRKVARQPWAHSGPDPKLLLAYFHFQPKSGS
jgi:hypothetical protein